MSDQVCFARPATISYEPFLQLTHDMTGPPSLNLSFRGEQHVQLPLHDTQLPTS